jgi:phosphoglycolate phosphatase
MEDKALACQCPSLMPTENVMRYQLLLWDFDGTLADTLDLSVCLYNRLAAKYGFRPIEDPQAVRSLTTLQFLKVHRISLSKLPVFRREFLALQQAQIETLRLFAGLPELLRAIGQKGVLLGVLSSNAEVNIRACLRANGVENLFRFIMSYPRILGKARAIRRVLQAHAIHPGTLLYIGDEARDIQAARKAGVDIAAVTWGFHSPEVLAGCSPTYQITDPEEILGLLDHANRG